MSEPPDQPVISFQDVHLAFDRPVLRGVSFELFRGATKIVLGGSGSGKTTILRLILGPTRRDPVDGVDVEA
jgi:ABC-type transporter Mla maintaining outer membrane lipid asymmetry ATPase subunit MlaF